MTNSPTEIRVGQFMATPVGVVLAVVISAALIMAAVPTVLVGVMFVRAGYFVLSAVLLVLLALFAYLEYILVRALVLALRNKDKPVLLFERDGFSCLSNDFSRREYVEYKDIVKVHKPDKTYKRDELHILQRNGTESVIVANGLALNGKEIFSILVERCPHLRQPYSTVMSLT